MCKEEWTTLEILKKDSHPVEGLAKCMLKEKHLTSIISAFSKESQIFYNKFTYQLDS